MIAHGRAGRGLLISSLYLAVPLAVVLTLSVLVDIAKPLWLDELIVSKVALLPDFRGIWKILTSGQSPHPPLNFLVVRAFYSLFGVSELTTRLPATLGFCLMEVCLFLFVAKRSNAAFGAVAMLFPLVTMARGFAFEAKPYGALLGWAGLALLCWRHAVPGSRWRVPALCGLGLSIACAVSTHFFGALLGLPIFAGEIVRWWEHRKPDWALWLVVAFSYCPLIFFLPILRAGNGVHGVHPWQGDLGLGFPFSSADQLLAGLAAPLLICLLVAAASRAGRAVVPMPKIPRDEIAAAAMLALIPVAALCGVRMAGIRVIEVKYVIPAVAGFAILAAWSAYAMAGRKMLAGTVLAAVLLVWGGRDFVRDLRAAKAQRTLAINFAPPLQARAMGPLPIVIETQLYMLLSHYARPEIADRLHFLMDLEAVQKYFHSDALHRSMMLNPGFFGPHVEQLAAFQAVHREFLIYESFPNDLSWMLEKYRDDGARIELLQGGSSERWYLVSTATPRH